MSTAGKDARAVAAARVRRELVALIRREGMAAFVEALPRAIESASHVPGSLPWMWNDVSENVVEGSDCSVDVTDFLGDMLVDFTARADEVAAQFAPVVEEKCVRTRMEDR